MIAFLLLAAVTGITVSGWIRYGVGFLALLVVYTLYPRVRAPRIGSAGYAVTFQIAGVLAMAGVWISHGLLGFADVRRGIAEWWTSDSYSWQGWPALPSRCFRRPARELRIPEAAQISWRSLSCWSLPWGKSWAAGAWTTLPGAEGG